MPASCEGPDDVNDTGYESTTNYVASIAGTVDPATGVINATATVVVSGTYDYGWLPGMPEYDSYLQYGGGRTCSGASGLSAFCSASFEDYEETATITGTLLPTRRRRSVDRLVLVDVPSGDHQRQRQHEHTADSGGMRHRGLVRADTG